MKNVSYEAKIHSESVSHKSLFRYQFFHIYLHVVQSSSRNRRGDYMMDKKLVFYSDPALEATPRIMRPGHSVRGICERARNNRLTYWAGISTLREYSRVTDSKRIRTIIHPRRCSRATQHSASSVTFQICP